MKAAYKTWTNDSQLPSWIFDYGACRKMVLHLNTFSHRARHTLLDNLVFEVQHVQIFIYACLPVRKLMIRSSKNRSTMSSPKGMKTAALRIFWRLHFDINRKFTAISLLTMETKSTRAFWGGAKAESFLREGSTSLRNCSCIPSVWEQTSPGKCYILCICCIMAWTCKATCPPASLLCQNQKWDQGSGNFCPWNSLHEQTINIPRSQGKNRAN